MNSKIASVAFTLLAVAFIPTRASMQSPPRVPAALAQAAAERPVRVIVTLNVPTQPETAFADESAVRAQRAAIAAAQQAVLDTLPGLAEAPSRFPRMPGFAITTDMVGLKSLAANPSVTGIYEDGLRFPFLVDTPAIIRADKLWAQGTEGSGWAVAVLDTGVDSRHSFFSGRVVSEACYSTDSPSIGATSLCPGRVARLPEPTSSTTTVLDAAYPTCAGISSCEHGTHVAGIATGRNNLFSGVARRANVIAVQVFTRQEGPDTCGLGNDGPCLMAYDSDILLGLERVLTLAGPNNTGKVGAVNLSLGGGFYTDTCDSHNPAITQAITDLRSLGIPTVAASGNELSSTELAFPACISSAISVAASTKSDTFAGFSNRNRLLSLVAPGEHIRSSVLNEGYEFETGTSMAAPHVAGAWALLKNIFPGVSVDTALRALQRTGVPVTDSVSGLTFPRIVLDKAAGSLGRTGSPTSVIATTVGSTVTVTWARPFDGSLPVGYHVEVASWENGGNVLGIVNVGNANSFAATLPDGRYLVRVRSITEAGRGEASNDIPVIVGTPPITQPPLAPRDLRAVVDGQKVTLYWNLALESPPADAYLVDVGSISAATNFGSFDTNSPALSAVAQNVNPGTYYVRVRGRNAFGASASSNEVIVTVAGSSCIAVPAPSSLNATVVGSLVTLNWNPPVIIGAVTGYVIEAGTSPGLSNVLSTSIGPQTAVAGYVGAGLYYVRVRAITACGISAASNEVTVVVP